MEKFDFSSEEYKRFRERCPFTDDELAILEMRRRGKTVVYMSLALSISERTVARCIKSIKRKISKEI